MQIAVFFSFFSPVGVSHDPYAGTFTKTETQENVRSVLKVMCPCLCVHVVCSFSHTHTHTRHVRMPVFPWLIFSKGFKAFDIIQTSNPL